MKKRKINKAKRVDHSCRNNGTCNYCRDSRLHQANKATVGAIEQLKNVGYVCDNQQDEGDKI